MVVYKFRNMQILIGSKVRVAQVQRCKGAKVRALGFTGEGHSGAEVQR